MMKRGVSRVLSVMAILTAILLLGGGCSVTQRVLQSSEPDLIYDHALKLYGEENWKKAVLLFETAEPYVAGTNREDSLLFFKARSYFKMADYDTATTELDAFRRSFGRSKFLEDAEGIYTLSHYYMSPEATRDQAQTVRAIRVIDEFISRYPESEQIENFQQIRNELDLRLHEKSFINAYTYYKIGRYKSAIVAFRSAMREYPESEYREKISFYVVASAYELARNSIDQKKEDRYLQMIDSYYTFLAEFPESDHREQADQMESRARAYIERQNKARARAAAGEAPIDNEDTRLFGRKTKRDKDAKELAIEIEEEKLD